MGEQTEDSTTPSKISSRPEVEFDGLRSAITPINLMFDGRLYKDLKGLATHITYAVKKINKERPDYQAALTEINLLESSFNAAFTQWEQHLTGEIQRLKNSVGAVQNSSLGATKKISKYQEELTRGRGSTRSMPIKIGQVRNQLIAASGTSPADASFKDLERARSRFVARPGDLPVVYKNVAMQAVRKSEGRPEKQFGSLALKLFKVVSSPLKTLEDQDVHNGQLYYFSGAVADQNRYEALIQQKSQFLLVTGVNEAATAYQLRSVFEGIENNFEIRFEDFNKREVFALNPLEDMEIVLQLLRAKFKQDEFKEIFRLYSSIRTMALQNDRKEMFNPKQQIVHQYLTGRIFEFIGLTFDNLRSEVRFVEQINNAIQLR
ncbi:MAG: hypothetical protein AB8B50_02470 [Pirellulaceae bacterium]